MHRHCYGRHNLRFHGVVVKGYGVASGQGPDNPYPDGAIRLQAPYFAARGIDLSPYFLGTLNVDLSPAAPDAGGKVFDGRLRWLPDQEERFLLDEVTLHYRGIAYHGLRYFPHPATKPRHFHRSSVIELLLPRIPGIRPGDRVIVDL